MIFSFIFYAFMLFFYTSAIHYFLLFSFISIIFYHYCCQNCCQFLIAIAHISVKMKNGIWKSPSCFRNASGYSFDKFSIFSSYSSILKEYPINLSPLFITTFYYITIHQYNILFLSL